MKKLRDIFFLVLTIVIATTIILIFTSKKKATNLPTEQPAAPNAQSREGKIIISTKEGEVEINDVTKTAIKTVPYGSNFEYILRDDPENYNISYYSEDQGFIIAINSPDIQGARDKAEKDFLDLLGVSKEQACKLKIDLGAIYSASREAAGQNFGLSFCPNGKPFPKN